MAVLKHFESSGTGIPVLVSSLTGMGKAVLERRPFQNGGSRFKTATVPKRWEPFQNGHCANTAGAVLKWRGSCAVALHVRVWC